MSLIVEDGSGLATAESFLSVADCTTYNDAHLAVAAWGSASTDAKERALRNATQYLEATYSSRWLGIRSTAVQALSWPRYEAELDGRILSSTALPTRLKDATAELAIKAVSETLMPDQANPGTILSESVSVGPLSTSTTYSGGKDQATWYRLADALVGALTYGTDDVRRA